jgi:hypothetical protein
MATARFTNSDASNIPGLRGRALQSVFPGMQMPGPTANSPATPVSGPATPAPTREFAMRAPTPNHISAATRAAQAVAAHLAANPVRPATPYVPQTRANTAPTQSAGTINTNYVNSAARQGYANVTPPDIYRGSRPGTQLSETSSGLLGAPGSVIGGRGPAHPREFYQNQVFIPTPQQARTNLFNPPQVPNPSPMVPNPQPTFPPRNNFLNILFPTQ